MQPLPGAGAGPLRDARCASSSSATSIEGETYPLEGEEVDLELPVRDTVLLDLPAAPLCREDCAGLCPLCGIDRNEADCDCDPNPPDPRWDALRALTFDD